MLEVEKIRGQTEVLNSAVLNIEGEIISNTGISEKALKTINFFWKKRDKVGELFSLRGTKVMLVQIDLYYYVIAEDGSSIFCFVADKHIAATNLIKTLEKELED